MKTKKPNMPESGTTWQEWADKSLIKDGEAGTTRRVRPEAEAQDRQPSPGSNWPYR